MSRTIRLTESQLYEVVREAVSCALMCEKVYYDRYGERYDDADDDSEFDMYISSPKGSDEDGAVDNEESLSESVLRAPNGQITEGFLWNRHKDVAPSVPSSSQGTPSKGYDYVGPFREGFAVVCLGDKWNFIDMGGNLMSDQWFDDVTSFRGGFAQVKSHGMWNKINGNGMLVSRWSDGYPS